jgi:zinc protease
MTRAIAIALLISALPAAALPLYRDSLPSGLVILTYEDHRQPLVDVALVCRSGHASDPADRYGVAAGVAHLLPRGTATMSGDSVTDVTDFLGASFNGWADLDNSRLRLRALSQDLGTSLDLAFDAARNPAFDTGEIRIARGQALQGIRRAVDYPTWRTGLEFDKLLFGDGPQGTPDAGDTISIPRITRTDLVAFHRTHWVPNNCFIVVVGDVDRAEVVRAVTARADGWQPGPVPTPTVEPAAWPARPRVKLITLPDLNQTNITLGHPGISINDPDWISVRLMSYILGGSALSSRLGIAVREEAGLAYDVNAWFDRGRFRGAFRSSVETNRPAEALRLMFAEYRRIREQGVTPAELTRAKNYFTGSFPLSYSSGSGKLDQVINIELNGFGLDWLERYPGLINAATREQLHAAARDRIDPDRYVMVIVGNVTREQLGLEGVEWVE